MRLIITILMLSALTAAQAQKISRFLEGGNSQKSELVIFAFGSDNPVQIGTVDAKGNLNTDLTEVKLPELSDDIKEMFISELRHAFAFSCGNSSDFGPQGTVSAIRGGNIALWANNEWTGSFFLVSDQELKSWLEDPGYNPAIKGSFWDIIYVEADVDINMSCLNEMHLEEGVVGLSYTYDLDLKKGFNWIEYSIEDIYVTDPQVMAAFPSKVRISNLSDPDRMKWIADYFF